jgi:hypothetical protein
VANRRHPRGAYVVVGGLALAAALSAFRLEHISAAERALSHGIRHVPDALDTPLEPMMMAWCS